MEEYIKKETIIKDLKNLLSLQNMLCLFSEANTTNCIIEKIKNACPADVVKKTYASWKPFFEDVEIYNTGGFTKKQQTGWQCSNCKNFEASHRKYCDNCGAIMINYNEK